MHQLLRQQLQHFSFNKKDSSPDTEELDALLKLVSETYHRSNLGSCHPKKEMLSFPGQSGVRSRGFLKRNERQLKAMVCAIPDIMFLVDTEGNYLDVFAEGKEHMLFIPENEIIGNNVAAVFEEDISTKFKDFVTRATKNGKLQRLEYVLTISGKKEYFEARAIPAGFKNKDLDTAIVIVRNITRQKEQENTSRLADIVFEEATEGIMIEDADHRIARVNPSMTRILGMTDEELVGKHYSFFSSMLSRNTFDEIVEMVNGESGHWHGEIELKQKHMDSVLGWLTVDAVRNDKGQTINYVIMLTDISEIKHNRTQMEYLATHDYLTKLPNRSLLFDRLEHSIARMKRSRTRGALMFIDVDHFKEVNDTYGHRSGDILLQQIAERLNHLVRESDTVGRLGGDEFLLIIEKMEHIDELLVIIDKIQKLFMTPFTLLDTEVDITVSIGIALFPDNGEDSQTLIHAADQAMYSVKRRGRNGFEFYSEDFSILSHEYFRIQTALKRAFREDHFSILYQPQFSLSDGCLTGIEALLRCRDRDVENIPVSRLITIAEESGIISEISRYVLQKSCEQVAKWQELFPRVHLGHIRLFLFYVIGLI